MIEKRSRLVIGSCVVMLFACACGYSSRGNAVVGQVKRVKMMTPLVCPDYVEVDLSLGVLRNGVGSTSREDAVLAIDPADRQRIDTLTRASQSGQIVHLSYDERRIAPCWPEDRVVEATIEGAGDGGTVPTPPGTSSSGQAPHGADTQP